MKHEPLWNADGVLSFSCCAECSLGSTSKGIYKHTPSTKFSWYGLLLQNSRSSGCIWIHRHTLACGKFNIDHMQWSTNLRQPLTEVSFIYLQWLYGHKIRFNIDNNTAYTCVTLQSGVIHNGAGAPTVAPQCPLLHLQKTLKTAVKHQTQWTFWKLVSWLFLFLFLLDILSKSGEMFGVDQHLPCVRLGYCAF